MSIPISNDSEGFHARMSTLELKLKESESERLKLEEKFDTLLRNCKSHESERLKLEEKFDTLLRNCKSHKTMQAFQIKESYRQLLEQDRLRCDRNDYILQSLEQLENRTYALNARTDRLRLLKNHYEAYIGRHYQEWKRDEKKNSSSLEPTRDYICSSNLQKPNLSTCRPLSRSASLNSPRTLSLSRKGSLIIPDTELSPSPKYTLSTDFSDTNLLGRQNLLGSTSSLNINTAHDVLSHKQDYVSNERTSPMPKLSVNESFFESTRSFTQDQSSIGEMWHTDKAINADKLFSKDKFDNLNKSDLSLAFSNYSTKIGRHPPTLSHSVDSNWSIRKPFKPSKPLTRSKSVTTLSSYSYKPEPAYLSEIKSVTRSPFLYRYSIPNKPLSRYSPKSSVSSFGKRSRSMSPLRVVDDIFKKYLINYDKRYLSDPVSESKYGKYLYPPKNAYRFADLTRAPVDDLSSVCDSKFNSFIPTFKTHSPSRMNAFTHYSLFDNNNIFTNSESRHRTPESDRHLLHFSSTNNWKDWNHYRDRYEYQFQFGDNNIHSDNFNYQSNRDFREEDRMKYDFTKPMGNSGSSFASPRYSDSYKSYQHMYSNERSKPSIQSARLSQVCPEKPIISKNIELDYTLRESLRSPQTPKRVSFSNECLYLDKSDTDASQSLDEVPISNYESDYLLEKKSRDYQDTEKEKVNLTDSSVKTTNSLVPTESSQDNSLDNIYHDIKPHIVDNNKKYTSNKYSDSFSESSDYNIKKNDKRRSSLFPNNDQKSNANSFDYDNSEKDADPSGIVDLISSEPMKEVEENKNSLEDLGKPLESLSVRSLETNGERVYDVDNNDLTANISRDNAEARGDYFKTELLNTDDLPHRPADPSNLNTVDDTTQSVPISANAQDVQHDSSLVVDESLKQNDAILGNEIHSKNVSNKDPESDQQIFKSTEHSKETVEKNSEFNPDYSEEITLKTNLEKQPEYENSHPVLQEHYDQQVNQDGIVDDSSKIPENETNYRNIEYDQTQAQFDNYQQQLPEQYSDEKYKEESVTDIEQSNDVQVSNSEQLGNIEKSYEQQPLEADYQQQPGDYDGYVQEEYQHQQFKIDDSGQQELYEQQNYEGQVKDEYLPHKQNPLNQEFSAVQYSDEYPQEYNQEPIQYQEEYQDQTHDSQAVPEQYPTDYAPSYQNDPLYQAQQQDSQIVQDQFRSDYEKDFQNETQYQVPNLANPTNIQEQYETDFNTGYEEDLQYQGQLQEPQNMPDQYVGDYKNGYQDNAQFQGELQALPNNQEQLGGEYDSTYQKDPQYQYEQEGAFEQTNIPEQYDQYDQQISEPYDQQYQRQPEQLSNYDYGYNGQGGGTDQTFMEESQPYNTTLATDYSVTPQMQNEDVQQPYTEDQGTFGDNPQPYEDTDYETQNNPSYSEYPVIENQFQTNLDPVMDVVNPSSYSPTPAPNPSGTTPNINRVLESDSESVLAKEGVPQEDSSDFDFSSEHK